MATELHCKYCGGENIAIKNNARGNSPIALVCKKCYKWQKWLSKKDYDVFHNKVEVDDAMDNYVNLSENDVVDGLSFDVTDVPVDDIIVYRAGVSIQDERVLNDAQDCYGKNFEKNIAIEELSELIKELAKDFRGIGDIDHISEEMADAYIMLRHLEIIYNNSSAVQNYIDRKITRLRNKMEDNDV